MADYEALPQDPKRAKLAEGVNIIQRNRAVGRGTLIAIALVRSLILACLLGATGWAAWCLRGVHFAEQAFDVNLSLDFCGQAAPLFWTAGTSDSGFVGLLRDTNHKAVTWTAADEGAQRLGLPTLRYFDSEEYFGGGPEHTIGLSAGLFKLNELRMKVSLLASLDDSRDCLARLGQELNVTENVAANFFGKAITEAMKQAGRAVPMLEVLQGPIKAHGAMLVWPEKNDTLWSVSGGAFLQQYAPSQGWEAYVAVGVTLWALTTGFALFVYARFFYAEWSKAAVYWVVQYDYLWHEPEVRDPDVPLPSQDDVGPAPGADPKPTPDPGTVFKNLPQACSTFFVLDHVVGNVVKNEEEWKSAVLSTLFQGVVLLAFTLLPLLQSCFFAVFKLPCLYMVIAHLCFAAAFGVAYYFKVPFRRRSLLLWGHYACCAALLVYSVGYFVAVLVFLITRGAASPGEAAAYSVPVCTIVVYAIVTSRQFVLMRNHYTKVLAGQDQKGVISSFLLRLDLDLRGIIFSVVCGVLSILLWTALLGFTNNLYVATNGAAELFYGFMTPVVTLSGAMIQLMGRRNYCEGVLTALVTDGTIGVFQIL